MARAPFTVTKVEAAGDHRLRLVFLDGATGVADLSHLEWVGVFADLEDPEYFARAELDTEMGTVVWPNGTDVAAEYLYDAIVGTARAAASG